MKRLGGTALLDARRPPVYSASTKLVRSGVLLFVVGFQLVPLLASLFGGSETKPSLDGVLISTAAGAAVIYIVGLFVMHVSRESSTGLIGFALSRVGSTLAGKLIVAIHLATLVLRLISAGFPDVQVLALLGSWSAAISYSLGILSALIVALHLVKIRRREYDQMHQWGNSVDGYLKSVIGIEIRTPEMHKVVHFTADAVEIFPVPAPVAMRFADIEANLARGHIDEWMLDPESTPARVRFIPIDDDERARRLILRASDYKLVGLVSIEVEDKEIQEKELPPAPQGFIDPAASSPAKPMSYETSQGFTERDLPQVQRFAEEQGMTIVGYDLKRWNADRKRHAKLVYVQKVDTEERLILDQISARLLNGRAWDMWFEFHWVDNDEEDKAEFPRRIDSVVVKRSPVAGLDPEKRLAQWQLIIGIMPKGSNGWVIEDDQQTGLVTLKYGKPLSLPAMVPYTEILPTQFDASRWWEVRLGKNGADEIVCTDLRFTPHGTVSGGTSSGKSTQERLALLSRLAHGHQIVIFDGDKDADDFRTIKPWTLMWGTTLTEIANGLAMLYEETRRRRRAFKPYQVANWYDLPPEALVENKIMPITVFFDEYEATIGVDAPDKALDKDSYQYIQALSDFRAVGQIKHYMQRLSTGARAAGVFLEVATQTPLAETLGSKLRNQLTNGKQLYSATLTSSTAGLALGATNGVRAMELFRQYTSFGSKGLAVYMNGEGELEAYRAGLIDGEEAAYIAGLGLAPVAPWRVTDYLALGLERESDSFEQRTEIAPPFKNMTHVGGTASGGYDDLEDSRPSRADGVSLLADILTGD